MKIDEGCINHNALRMIDKIIENVSEHTGQNDNDDHDRIVALAQIGGIVAFAEVMKEVLKV